jgi:hypothetical protein
MPPTQANRPHLREVSLRDVLPPRPGRCYATVSVGQPLNALLRTAYALGFVLLELDDCERPVRAYRKAGVRDN